jgi:hypothetical protein
VATVTGIRHRPVGPPDRSGASVAGAPRTRVKALSNEVGLRGSGDLSATATSRCQQVCHGGYVRPKGCCDCCGRSTCPHRKTRPRHRQSSEKAQQAFKKGAARLREIAQAHPEAKRFETWSQDEAPVDRKGGLQSVELEFRCLSREREREFQSISLHHRDRP